MSRRALLGLLPLLACVACASGPASTAPVPAPAGYGQAAAADGQRYQSQPPALAPPIRPPTVARPAAAFGQDDSGLEGMAAGETERAEQSFERALEVNPFDPVALNNLAVAKAEQGQFHEATALLERAAKLQPDNAEIAANLARLRGYVQGYAMAGVEPAGPVQPQRSGLPPAPPPLWGSRAVVLPHYSQLPEGGSAATVPVPRAASASSDYYVSEVCRKQATTGSQGKAKTATADDCQPAR